LIQFEEEDPRRIERFGGVEFLGFKLDFVSRIKNRVLFQNLVFSKIHDISKVEMSFL